MNKENISMDVKLIPINDENREAVLKLTTREDQPFCAPNDYSLEQAGECNAECPVWRVRLRSMREISPSDSVCSPLIPRKRIRRIDIGSGAL